MVVLQVRALGAAASGLGIHEGALVLVPAGHRSLDLGRDVPGCAPGSAFFLGGGCLLNLARYRVRYRLGPGPARPVGLGEALAAKIFQQQVQPLFQHGGQIVWGHPIPQQLLGLHSAPVLASLRDAPG